MAVVISLLRAVNVGPHNKVKMDTLRELYTELGLRDVQSYVQSGNVVFRTTAQDLARLRNRLEAAVAKTFGVSTDVILRTPADLRSIIARNPFAKRSGIEPNKLHVNFLSAEPAPDARERIAQIKVSREELHLDGLELYMYYPDGMGRSKLTPAVIERALKTSGTARNWNTVTKLLEMAEKI
jgi:uncharacterized protein (DUF1697 family)